MKRQRKQRSSEGNAILMREFAQSLGLSGMWEEHVSRVTAVKRVPYANWAKNIPLWQSANEPPFFYSKDERPNWHQWFVEDVRCEDGIARRYLTCLIESDSGSAGFDLVRFDLDGDNYLLLKANRDQARANLHQKVQELKAQRVHSSVRQEHEANVQTVVDELQCLQSIDDMFAFMSCWPYEGSRDVDYGRFALLLRLSDMMPALGSMGFTKEDAIERMPRAVHSLLRMGLGGTTASGTNWRGRFLTTIDSSEWFDAETEPMFILRFSQFGMDTGCKIIHRCPHLMDQLWTDGRPSKATRYEA